MTAPDPLGNAIGCALATAHRHLGIRRGLAARYPADVAPFAALESSDPNALDDLASLLTSAEIVYLLGDRLPEHPAFRYDGVVPCLQMLLPTDDPLPLPVPEAPEVVPLTCEHAGEMVDLITAAFPGYFRPQTCRMGRYWGIRDSEGTLVAMGGERLVLTAAHDPYPWREISGLCSHPALAGKGAGTTILHHILRQHRAEGSHSWLHVGATNTRAVELYQRTGFQVVRPVELHRLQRLPR